VSRNLLATTCLFANLALAADDVIEGREKGSNLKGVLPKSFSSQKNGTQSRGDLVKQKRPEAMKTKAEIVRFSKRIGQPIRDLSERIPNKNLR
jgi:hypothetical protein